MLLKCIAGAVGTHRAGLERRKQDHLKKDNRELLVREREGPEPEVGGRVGDAAEHVLDRVDHLVNHHLRSGQLHSSMVSVNFI